MPAQGFVQVHVYTSSANLPIQDAAVSFTRILPDGGTELLAFRTTDSSGNTEIIAIPTPEISASQNPQQPGGFSDITIAADAPQYDRVRIENVQIFPGVTTLQEIRLTPKDALPERWGESELFQVTPQPL